MHLARTALAAASVVASALSTPASAQTIQAENFAQLPGGQLLVVEFAPGVPDAIYVADRTGLVWRYANGAFDSTPFLDITDRVEIQGEGGFIGFTFHPDFQGNGYIFVSYTNDAASGDSVLSRISVPDPTTATFADPSTETMLLPPIAHDGTIHKAGDLEFGVDGMLYWSVGDGNIGNVAGFDTSQVLDDLRGKILRFDVDAPFPHVPADNPFVGVAGANELVYAYGLRNPFRFGIDPVSGDLYTGDVGAGGFEEVNRIPAMDGGLNFGWRCREGLDCTASPSCSCPSMSLTDPIAVLLHEPTSPICAVTGGTFVRNTDIPGLENSYIFADYCSGRAYSILDPAGAAILQRLNPGFVDGNGQPIRFVVDFAQAPDGTIYFVQQTGGRVWRLLPPEDFGNHCVSNPNSTGAAALIAATGSPSLADEDLTLTAARLPFNQFGFFLLSRGALIVPLTGSDGNLCVGPTVFRWGPIFNSGATGIVSRTTDYSDLPFGVTIAPGETWNFQYWTRDVTSGPSSNTSNAASVRFVN